MKLNLSYDKHHTCTVLTVNCDTPCLKPCDRYSILSYFYYSEISDFVTILIVLIRIGLGYACIYPSQIED